MEPGGEGYKKIKAMSFLLALLCTFVDPLLFGNVGRHRHGQQRWAQAWRT